MNQPQENEAGLFRKEVTESRQEDWMGSIQLINFKLGWTVAALAGLMALVLVLILLLGRFTETEEVNGQIVPSSGLLGVTSPGTGFVIRTLVEEGEYVEEGQALLEISLERASTAVGEIGAAVAVELENQRWRLQDKLDGLPAMAERQTANLTRRRDYLREQLELTAKQYRLRKQQFESALGLLQRIEQLNSSGQFSALQLQQYEFSALEAEAHWRDVQSQELMLRQELAETEEQLELVSGQIQATRTEIEQSAAEVSQAIALNEGERSLLVRAPRAGMISGMTAHGGQSIASGQVLLAIVPTGSELLAELWVPASAVGRIEIGGRAMMRYHSYPFRRYGQQPGEIIQVAHRALSPEEIQVVSGLKVEAPAFRVLVRPMAQVVEANGVKRELRTGMTLDAALHLEKRRVLEMTGILTGARKRHADHGENLEVGG